MLSVEKIYAYFILCSFVGWILETVYKSLAEKRFINSGFLYGPFVPIYGFGGVFIYVISLFVSNLYFPLQVVIFTVVAVVLEYFTAFLFEKIFSIKLWDYSHERFNLHGRICLRFSIYWAMLIVFHVVFVQPFLFELILLIDKNALYLFSVVFTVYFVTDIFFSSRLYLRFSHILKSGIERFAVGISPEQFINKINRMIKDMLIPVSRFSNLKVELKKAYKNIEESINNLRQDIDTMYDVKHIIDNMQSGSDGWKSDSIFYNAASDIVNHPQYMMLDKFNHHGSFSIYQHNIRVAWIAYNIGKKLKLRHRELIRGALLHDFFMYDWREERPQSGKLHGFEHPKESLSNAEKYFSPLNSVERDIILKHMWPLTVVPPRYKESFIVCIADKIAATYEFISGDKK